MRRVSTSCASRTALLPSRRSSACCGNWRWTVWVCVISLLVVSLPVLASDSDPVPGKLVIKFSQQIVPLSITRGGSGISTGIAWLDSINLNYGLLEIRPLYPRPFNPSLAAWYRLMFPPEAPIVSLIDSFQSHSDVVHAEASYRLIPETPCDPNDSLFVLHSGPLSNQWFHSVLRTNSSPYVWNCGQGVVGDSNVLIAIVDTGRLCLHTP